MAGRKRRYSSADQYAQARALKKRIGRLRSQGIVSKSVNTSSVPLKVGLGGNLRPVSQTIHRLLTDFHDVAIGEASTRKLTKKEQALYRRTYEASPLNEQPRIFKNRVVVPKGMRLSKKKDSITLVTQIPGAGQVRVIDLRDPNWEDKVHAFFDKHPNQSIGVEWGIHAQGETLLFFEDADDLITNITDGYRSQKQGPTNQFRLVTLTQSTARRKFMHEKKTRKKSGTTEKTRSGWRKRSATYYNLNKNVINAKRRARRAAKKAVT